jgi:glutamate racemase
LTFHLNNSRPIGIFDSGVGGLTVLHAVRQRLPRENIIYLGDTARVPYGTKSRETIERYAVEDAAFLVEKGIKMIVVACNTASAMSRERLRREFDLPILSVLGPGARMAVRLTRNRRIGVIATEATIESRAYEDAIREASGHQELDIFARACPLFVPLVEEGEVDSPITSMVAEKYLAPLRGERIDTLLLGCTHYPLLKKIIAGTIGEDVSLVDSAEATAEEAANLLERERISNQTGERGSSQFYVTDAAKRFHRIAENILGEPLPHLDAVEVWGHDRLETK